MKRQTAAKVGFRDLTPVQKPRRIKAKKKNLAQKPWRIVVRNPPIKSEYSF